MKPLNFLLVSLDTLRADVAYGAGLPNLDAFAERGTSFLNTVASAPVTPVSHASVFTGLQPYDHGIRHLFREQLTCKAATLAELVAARGYRTGAIVSCPGLNRWYGMDAGFAHYDDEIPRLPDGSDPLQTVDVKLRGSALKRAPIVVERGLEWLEPRRSDPFFLFLHFFDTHWPYKPPESFAHRDVNPYEGEAFYVDHFLGRFLESFQEWGLFDNTLVIVFSDHGEDLAGWYSNDHAGEELGHPEEEGHGCLLFDATQMVPLMIVAPEGVPAGRRVETQVRLVDILPTAVDLLGIEDRHARAGSSLVELLEREGDDRKAYSEAFYREEVCKADGSPAGLGPWVSLRTANRSKVIVDLSTGSLASYDLVSDPRERNPTVFGPPVF